MVGLGEDKEPAKILKSVFKIPGVIIQLLPKVFAHVVPLIQLDVLRLFKTIVSLLQITVS